MTEALTLAALAVRKLYPNHRVGTVERKAWENLDSALDDALEMARSPRQLRVADHDWIFTPTTGELSHPGEMFTSTFKRSEGRWVPDQWAFSMLPATQSAITAAINSPL